MGMEKFYRTVRRKFGVDKQQMKREVTEELREELGEEISYIEAELKEYEQLVAEVNHLLTVMRKERIQERSESGQVKMSDFDKDMEPLKSKLEELESSMRERLEEQKAYF
jgi:translation initiation factor 2 alpha subunit (eIF-2alpha)